MKLLDEFYEFESSYVNWKDRGEEYEQMREKMREYVSQLMPNLTKEQRASKWGLRGRLHISN